MTLAYGFAKGKVTSQPRMKASKRPHEIQYHLHFTLAVGDSPWDVAVNVGTNDSDDLLRFKLLFDFSHSVTATLDAAEPGKHDLTGTDELPALDFQRCADLFAGTGKWRESDIMDGTAHAEPAASLMRLLLRAREESRDVFVFGRFYPQGAGVHDTHMNQGSSGGFIHRGDDDSNDHNDVWQDGAVLVHLGDEGWAAYFAAFEKQLLPTDDLGNPKEDARPVPS